MAEKQMTRTQLIRVCRLQDEANRHKETIANAKEVKLLVRALTTPGVRLYPWQMEEVKRHVYEAYGRAKLQGQR